MAERRGEASIQAGADPAHRREAALLRNCASLQSGTWSPALPTAPTSLGNTSFRHAARHPKGANVPLHLALPPLTCGHGIADSADHAMVCDQCNMQAKMCHDLLAAAVCRVASRAGLPSNRETSYRCLADSAAEAEASGLTRSDVGDMAPDGTLFILDIVITHQLAGCKLAECHGHTSKAAALAAADKVPVSRSRTRFCHLLWSLTPGFTKRPSTSSTWLQNGAQTLHCSRPARAQD
jgi:hypothetical protein